MPMRDVSVEGLNKHLSVRREPIKVCLCSSFVDTLFQ